ncbi:DNA phosphorothioation-dependent restriction protein DptG, partial [Pantoea sp. SIMBA_079]|uniref:DNA phosphorothioation-dependent restriction protein DptG n=1 Tax=Pantoea sp. SIMBA_079 TaxID=3085817 RepID=UPI003996A395
MLPPAQLSATIEDVFQQLEAVAMEQFRVLQSHRSGVNKKYMLELEGQLGADFIVNRGRAGKVLVLNQDQLVLLTNLSIGSQEKLRLHELV